jgi:hypothetical protein
MPHKDLQKRKEYQRMYWFRNKIRKTIAHKKWCNENLDSVRSYHRKWEERNLERVKNYMKNFYLKNRDKILAKQKSRRVDNLEYVREIARKSAKRNSKQRLAYCYKIRKENINVRIANSLRARIRNVLREKHITKINHLKDLIGIPICEFKTYLESKFTEGMNWENYGKWHIDHKIPLSKFNLSDIEEQKKACFFTNLQPLWASDNCSKKDKILNEI